MTVAAQTEAVDQLVEWLSRERILLQVDVGPEERGVDGSGLRQHLEAVTPVSLKLRTPWRPAAWTVIAARSNQVWRRLPEFVAPPGDDQNRVWCADAHHLLAR